MPITVWHGGTFKDHDPKEIANLPYAAGSCDAIEVRGDLARFVGSHATEAVGKLASYLRTGGDLRVSVPDFDRLVDAYQKGSSADIEEKLLGKGGEHGSIWNRQKISDTFKAAGIEEVRPWQAGEEELAVAVEGRKVEPITELRNVEALISMPRLAWTENMFCAIAALIPLKINVTKHTGAFWGQCLSRLIREAIAKPSCEWILTLDYDSIFSKEDVVSLYRLATSKNLDAVAAMQIGRERNTVLITCEDAEGKARNALTLEEIQSDALQVATAHFGLTLIKAEALRNLPLPWFHGQPAPDGTWGEGRIDDDIQFWRQWQRCGYKLWQSNRVRIGHIQVMVTWPDQRLAARHQYHSEYVTNGKPDYAR